MSPGFIQSGGLRAWSTPAGYDNYPQILYLARCRSATTTKERVVDVDRSRYGDFNSLPGKSAPYLASSIFVIENTEIIVSANASAQTLTGTTREEVCGTSLWRAAPHLVSPSLYQAVQKAKQTREPAEVAYGSPVTNTWLHVSLSPTKKNRHE
jgi:PAS domain S-box-containing protein